MATREITYEQEVPLTYDNKKIKYEVVDTYVMGKPFPDSGIRLAIDGKTDDSAGAGRGKKYAAGGRVKSFKGYGKAKKV